MFVYILQSVSFLEIRLSKSLVRDTNIHTPMFWNEICWPKCWFDSKILKLQNSVSHFKHVFSLDKLVAPSGHYIIHKSMFEAPARSLFRMYDRCVNNRSKVGTRWKLELLQLNDWIFVSEKFTTYNVLNLHDRNQLFKFVYFTKFIFYLIMTL